MKARLIALFFGLVLVVGSASAQVIVRIGPPPRPPRVIVPVRPGPAYVWTPGYYRVHRNRYIWVPGRYVVPPRRHAVWVPGYWTPRRGGHIWIAGYWR